MLKVAGFNRYDMLNAPMSDKPSFTIWFSGCTHRCEECQNENLWDPDSGDEYSMSELYDLISACRVQYGIRDVVLLGGEPLQQDRDDMVNLCETLHEVGINVWLYTGYDFDYIEEEFGEIMPYLHTIKCGKYDKNLVTGSFPASSNQKLFRRNSQCWHELTL